MEFFDSHAHYNDKKFNEDRDELIKSIYSEGVTRIINAGYSLETSGDGKMLIEYKGKRLNSTIVENTMWERFVEECQSKDLDEFSVYMKANSEDVYELIELAIGR